MQKKGTSKESIIDSCEIMFSVNGWSKTVEMKMFVVNGTILQEQDFTYRMSEPEYFYYRQNWWISLNKSGSNTQPVRKRSDFNQALSTLNRLHREAGGQQLWPMPYWKYQQPIPTGIEFFLQLVTMERILVIFLRIQRKTMREDACKGL